MSENNSTQIIRPHRLCKLAGISVSTLYRWESEGKLPFKKIKLGPRAVGFRESEVNEWLNGKTQVMGGGDA